MGYKLFLNSGSPSLSLPSMLTLQNSITKCIEELAPCQSETHFSHVVMQRPVIRICNFMSDNTGTLELGEVNLQEITSAKSV